SGRFRWWLVAASVVLAGRAQAAAVAPVTGGGVEKSVVKVFSTVRSPNYAQPWNKQASEDVSGSGVVIEGKRILTNAHVVLYASQVQVQAFQAGDKISATVEAIAPGIDLAVLKLDDDKLFATHPPLARAAGLPIQIDAAINPGNSGGPAVVGDKMIGLAFSTLGRAQNIGYIIPNEEIDLFLKDVADGSYDGKPALFDDLQTLENPALRAFLKLGPEVEGIVVSEPFSRAG